LYDTVRVRVSGTITVYVSVRDCISGTHFMTVCDTSRCSGRHTVRCRVRISVTMVGTITVRSTI
jgi:hypothetical protein